MELIYFYAEPKSRWIARGYANNIWLRVNYSKKTFKLTTTYTIPPRDVPTVLTVTSKSDLTDLAVYLEKMGFRKIKG